MFKSILISGLVYSTLLLPQAAMAAPKTIEFTDGTKIKASQIYYPGDYVQEQFLITNNNGQEFYGQSIKNPTGEGIYFLKENIIAESPKNIHDGDVILATFEKKTDELLAVDLVKRNQYKSFDFIISKVKGNDYYGYEMDNPKNKIHFKKNQIFGKSKIKKGDGVQVFYKDNKFVGVELYYSEK